MWAPPQEKSSRNTTRNQQKDRSRSTQRSTWNGQSESSLSQAICRWAQATKESDIKVTDLELVQQHRKNKLSSRFHKTPLTVVHRRGTQVTVGNKRKKISITRNVSHFEKFTGKIQSGLLNSGSEDGVFICPENRNNNHLDQPEILT